MGRGGGGGGGDRQESWRAPQGEHSRIKGHCVPAARSAACPACTPGQHSCQPHQQCQRTAPSPPASAACKVNLAHAGRIARPSPPLSCTTPPQTRPKFAPPPLMHLQLAVASHIGRLADVLQRLRRVLAVLAPPAVEQALVVVGIVPAEKRGVKNISEFWFPGSVELQFFPIFAHDLIQFHPWGGAGRGREMRPAGGKQAAHACMCTVPLPLKTVAGAGAGACVAGARGPRPVCVCVCRGMDRHATWRPTRRAPPHQSLLSMLRRRMSTKQLYEAAWEGAKSSSTTC